MAYDLFKNMAYVTFVVWENICKIINDDNGKIYVSSYREGSWLHEKFRERFSDNQNNCRNGERVAYNRVTGVKWE
ncbi:hypothetical protein LRA02_12180 [Lentilactobacillus rapi]|uniref:Uncharacterized protein n=1 Tax=Lentilactobacillus rapi TaxID=481723 RepID=A0A512PME1_9LACO|nr:hypothetical protein LRA02_12180 [Lentilactobacillus rapi]